MEKRKITLPLTRELAKTLHAGDQVLVTGTIYTSRDAFGVTNIVFNPGAICSRRSCT